jgi:hypothetical protein
MNDLICLIFIYRIGFKLGRKGGIKPVPRTIAQPG